MNFPQRAMAVLCLLVLAACNGKTVVTLTSTASTDTFLTYRVGLVSIQLQTGNGRTASTVLPNSTTVDLAQLVNLSEVVGASSGTAGNFSQAVVTLDYGSADIVYDDGSLNGIPLKPIGAGGQALGLVTLILYLDPSDQLTVSRGSAGHLSLDFNLAASNVVNATQGTVMVLPLMSASASPLDTKVVRIRGPLGGVNTSTTDSVFGMGIEPFNFTTTEAGSLQISPSTVTTYEINGAPTTGNAGLAQLATLSGGALTVAYGTLTTTSTSSTSSTTSTGTTTVTVCADGSAPTTSTTGVSICADGSTPTTTNNSSSTPTTGTGQISFAATEVLAGSSVQGSGFDRVSGIVSGRSGNTFTVQDGTLIAADGTNSFIAGTATITVGANTQVTSFGSGSPESNGLQQISVGSAIDAFGTLGNSGNGNLTLDASAGRARLGTTSASGLVTVQGTGTLSLALKQLGGRSASAFDFAGTGTSTSYDASAADYQITTGPLDLTNAVVGSPVEATGLVAPFGVGPPDFNAATLLDSTTIYAELVTDWSGTPAPFASYDSSQMVLNARNSSISGRNLIQIGAQTVQILGIASNPIIIPNATATNAVFTIGHAASGTFENFNTYSAFITQLQLELNGSVLALGITAQGQYTATSYTFSASGITLLLNN